jgi:hypothetical protein
MTKRETILLRILIALAGVFVLVASFTLIGQYEQDRLDNIEYYQEQISLIVESLQASPSPATWEKVLSSWTELQSRFFPENLPGSLAFGSDLRRLWQSVGIELEVFNVDSQFPYPAEFIGRGPIANILFFLENSRNNRTLSGCNV